MPIRQKRSYLQNRGQNAGQKQGRQPAKPKVQTDKQRAKSQQRVTEPLDMRGLRKETRAATNQRFRPLEKEIAGELRASNRRVKETGNWWQNYLDTVNQGRAETQAAYAQAGATNADQIAQASQIDSANTQALQAEAAKSAELRGVAPSTAPAEREAAAQAQRNYLAAAQGGATQQMGANQFAYLTDQKRIGVGQSIASRKEEQRRGRSIMKDRRDVRRERGDYATTKRQELRDKEREYLIQRRAFPEAKAERRLEEREGARDARENAQERAEDRRQRSIENRQRQEGIGIDRRKTRNDERGEGNPEAKEGRRNATATANRLVKQYGVPKTAKEWADLEEAVAKESEVSPSEARQAVKRVKARAASKEPAIPGGWSF